MATHIARQIGGTEGPGGTCIGAVASSDRVTNVAKATTSWGFGDELEAKVAFDVDAIELTVWKVDEEIETRQVRMTGRLDRVDLRARPFDLGIMSVTTSPSMTL